MYHYRAGSSLNLLHCRLKLGIYSATFPVSDFCNPSVRRRRKFLNLFSFRVCISVFILQIVSSIVMQSSCEVPSIFCSAGSFNLCVSVFGLLFAQSFTVSSRWKYFVHFTLPSISSLYFRFDSLTSGVRYHPTLLERKHNEMKP